MFLIQYDYPGTTGGQPVGAVYVTGPHFGKSIYSHTYDPTNPDVAVYDTFEAAQLEISRRPWPNARVIERSDAPHLGTEAAS